MTHEFDTLQDALDAGYEMPGRTDRDVSGSAPGGGQYFGYDFDRNGQRTVDVWFRLDRNKMNQPGCFRAMFPPSPSEGDKL